MHPRPAQPRAARPPKKRRRKALAQGNAAVVTATPPAEVQAAAKPSVATARKAQPAPPLFEVEHIRQCWKVAAGGRLEYQVSWVGYPEADDSWEPAANLALAPAVVASFSLAAAMPVQPSAVDAPPPEPCPIMVSAEPVGSSDKMECTICLDEPPPGTEICSLPCVHTFCHGFVPECHSHTIMIVASMHCHTRF